MICCSHKHKSGVILVQFNALTETFIMHAFVLISLNTDASFVLGITLMAPIMCKTFESLEMSKLCKVSCWTSTNHLYGNWTGGCLLYLTVRVHLCSTLKMLMDTDRAFCLSSGFCLYILDVILSIFRELAYTVCTQTETIEQYHREQSRQHWDLKRISVNIYSFQKTIVS